MILKNKKVIIKNKHSLHNLKLIVGLFKNDREASEKICQVYERECFVALFNGCINFFKLKDNWSDKTSFIPSSDLLHDTKLIEIKKYAYNKISNEEPAFYFEMFVNIRDCDEILTTATNKFIFDIYNKPFKNNKKPKPKTIVHKVLSSLKKYRLLSPEEKAEAINYITSKPPVA